MVSGSAASTVIVFFELRNMRHRSLCKAQNGLCCLQGTGGIVGHYNRPPIIVVPVHTGHKMIPLKSNYAAIFTLFKNAF